MSERLNELLVHPFIFGRTVEENILYFLYLAYLKIVGSFGDYQKSKLFAVELRYSALHLRLLGVLRDVLHLN